MQACDEDVTEIEVKSDGSWRTRLSRPFMDLERWHLPEGSLSTSKFNINSNSNMEISEVKSEHEGNQLEECVTPYGHEVISMSSGSSDNNMKEDDNNEMMDSMPYNNNYNQTSGITNRSSSSSIGDPSVIVLSDSDEDNCDIASATEDPVVVPPGSLDVKAESSQMSNGRGGGLGLIGGDPFTFPRQPRTVRNHHGTKDVAAAD